MTHLVSSILIVGLGSFVGGALRFIISYWMKTFVATGFPWATLTVNLLGCLLFGVCYGLFHRFGNPASHWCLLLTTGLCGGFTTFSTFSFESLQLFQNGNFAALVCYICTSVLFGILFVALGWWLVR